MTYRVVWTEQASNVLGLEFFLAWEKGGDYEGIDVAVDHLTQLLSENPHLIGESRGNNLRIAFSGPVSIIFEPFVNQAVVLIYKAKVAR